MNDPVARGPPWTEEAIARLRQALLEDALRRLSPPRTPDRNRHALLAWVLSDEINAVSFRVCAAASGCDADALREKLLRLLRADAGQERPGGRLTLQILAWHSRATR